MARLARLLTLRRPCWTKFPSRCTYDATDGMILALSQGEPAWRGKAEIESC
jgi:hypothetical protein